MTMKMKYILAGLACLAANLPVAAKWLPKTSQETCYRLLECVYQDAQLKTCDEIESDADWTVVRSESDSEGRKVYAFTFTAQRDMEQAGVAVAFDEYDWCSDNYVMIPAAVYNGNRQRIVNRKYATGLDPSDYFRRDLALTSNPIPQLSPDYGAESRLEVLVNNTATPAIAYLKRAPRQGILLLTDQGIEWNGQMLDHALIVEESNDRSRASFVISAPGVREKKPEFIGFGKSPDRGLQVRKGDRITLRVTKLTFPCANVPELLAHFMRQRKSHIGGPDPRNLMPMSEVFARMVKNIVPYAFHTCADQRVL